MHSGQNLELQDWESPLPYPVILVTKEAILPPAGLLPAPGSFYFLPVRHAFFNLPAMWCYHGDGHSRLHCKAKGVG